MQKRVVAVAYLSLVLAIQPVAAMAYIGPGVGAGAFAAVLGVIGAIFLAIVAVLYYPIKRMLKGRKSKVAKGSGDGEPAE